LESERTQWEQRYLEETAMRQVAIDAASIPKDAKIAALEKTSAESEKLIADARNDKMRQFEDMQNAQVRKNNLFYFLSQKIRQITAHTSCYSTRLNSKK
jgi:angiomotin like 1